MTTRTHVSVPLPLRLWAKGSAHTARLIPALTVATWGLLVWVLAPALATWLRHLGGQTSVALESMILFVGCAIALQAGFEPLVHRFRGRHLIGSVDDAVSVASTTVSVGVALFVVGLSPLLTIPRNFAVIATFVALPLALWPRAVLRLFRERRARPDPASAESVIVFGAGYGGHQIVRSMLSDADCGYLPVALLDDDPAMQGRRICRVPVRGTRSDLAEIARATGASLLVVAVHDLDVESMRTISNAATQAGLRVKVLPALQDLFRPWIGFTDLRDLDIADLIGRHPVEVDVNAIAGYLTGKSVLVTGAGGSIGSELCRQVQQYGPAELLMLDRDESALHALQLSIHGRALLDSPDVILADIRDASTIREIFTERRPDVVFHAAALKHLPMLEQYPHEAWQTNVLGTVNVLDAAVEAEVATFVNISTDKAANPSSMLGYSKRIGERLVAHVAAESATGTYVSVRFGNVIGSRGSVITTFAEQIAGDLPITVTHPDVTRFFMTIPEAVRLVIQAAAIGRPGEALVLDMGEPVRIVDLAKQLTVLAGRSVEIRYTGLRDGEKLHEELFGAGETDVRPVHPAVSHVAVPRLDPTAVRATPSTTAAAGAAMVRLTYLPASELAGDGEPDAQVIKLPRAYPRPDQPLLLGERR